MSAHYQELLGRFLSFYQGLKYSDYVRLQTFVVLLSLLGIVALFLIPILGLANALTGVFLILWSGFCTFLLVLIRNGGRIWAEGLSAIGFASLFIGLIFSDDSLRENQLGDTLMLVYANLNLVLVAMTTSSARWIVATSLPYLVAEMVFRFSFQETLELNFPFRFVIIETTVCLLLVTIQRIIRRANTIADEAQAQLVEANNALAVTVHQQAHELQNALDQVRTAQRSLSEGDKLSTLGRFVAGIAHEINTPLAAIDSSASTIRDLLRAISALLLDDGAPWTPKEKRLLGEILGATDRSGLSSSSQERRALKKQLTDLVGSEGQPLPPELVDHLAEWGLLKPRKDWIDFLVSERGLRASSLIGSVVELIRSTGIIAIASEKASAYVSQLRKFIAKDRTDHPPQAVPVLASIETFLLLYQNQLRGRIDVVRSYPRADPLVQGYPDRLLQVWSNLISNAVGAMGEKGRLGIEVSPGPDSVDVTIVDDGPGIPDSVRDRIFEPFFSTKEAGEGMGLGLEIVRNIVEEHRGQIRFESEPGKTSFILTLPSWKAL